MSATGRIPAGHVEALVAARRELVAQGFVYDRSGLSQGFGGRRKWECRERPSDGSWITVHVTSAHPSAGVFLRVGVDGVEHDTWVDSVQQALDFLALPAIGVLPVQYSSLWRAGRALGWAEGCQVAAGSRSPVASWLEQRIDEWHDAPAGSPIAAKTLHEHLGMTFEQYQAWASPQVRGSLIARHYADCDAVTTDGWRPCTCRQPSPKGGT